MLRGGLRPLVTVLRLSQVFGGVNPLLIPLRRARSGHGHGGHRSLGRRALSTAARDPVIDL
jgi:hypothetical protein